MKSEIVGADQILSDGHTAGIGVLHNDTGWRVKALHTLQCRVGIRDVVIGQGLALQLFGVADADFGLPAVTVKRGTLMWVLAVAHLLHLLQLQIEGAGILLRATLGEATKMVGDHAVIGGSVFISANRQIKSRCQRRVAVVSRQLLQHPRVIA